MDISREVIDGWINKALQMLYLLGSFNIGKEEVKFNLLFEFFRCLRSLLDTQT